MFNIPLLPFRLGKLHALADYKNGFHFLWNLQSFQQTDISWLSKLCFPWRLVSNDHLTYFFYWNTRVCRVIIFWNIFCPVYSLPNKLALPEFKLKPDIEPWCKRLVRIQYEYINYELYLVCSNGRQSNVYCSMNTVYAEEECGGKCSSEHCIAKRGNKSERNYSHCTYLSYCR